MFVHYAFIYRVYINISGGNKKFWNDVGVKHAQNTVLLNNPIIHPSGSSRTLEIIPDVVHVFKSIVHGWINNKSIELPDAVVKENGLISGTVDIAHLSDLVRFEQHSSLKMACGLKLEDVNFSKPMSNFDKMKVINSKKYANHTVACSLRMFSAISGREEVLSTAFFVGLLSRWFDYMCSRSPDLAFSYTNQEAYTKALETLHSFRRVIYQCKVGATRHWKPWQASAVLTTDSVIRLQKYFLDEKRYNFFCAGRLSQDCLENIFAQLRQRQPKPTALQAKDNLKLLCVAQYMGDVKNSSYEMDERNWLVGFSDHLKMAEVTPEKNFEERAETENKCSDDTKSSGDECDMIEYCENLSKTTTEHNMIYYLAGMVVRNIGRLKICDKCLTSCTSQNLPEADCTAFSKLKDFTGHSLTNVNIDTFNFFFELEEIFKKEIKVSMRIWSNASSK